MRFWPFKRKQKRAVAVRQSPMSLGYSSQGTLYISGSFTNWGGGSDHIAKWTGDTWSAMDAPKTSIVYTGDAHMLSWEEAQTQSGNDVMSAPERHCYYCGVRFLSSLAKCPHCNGPQKIH